MQKWNHRRQLFSTYCFPHYFDFVQTIVKRDKLFETATFMTKQL